jgi:hypothetical protein
MMNSSRGSATQVGKAKADDTKGISRRRRQHWSVKGRDETWLARGTRAKGKPAYGEHPGHRAMKKVET